MNTFGNKFRVSILGESHGPVTGVVIDGVTPGLPLSADDFRADIDRRRPGAAGTTARREADIPEIVSGLYNGHASGAPLTILFRNMNARPEDYADMSPRPGHADLTAAARFKGFNDPRGGGQFSGRLTLPLVAAGVVAKKMLPFSFSSDIRELGGSAERGTWAGLVEQALEEGDSLGAVVECRIEGVPAGLGEPFWDSVESLLAHAVFAIPGVRGIEFGMGFGAAAVKGSAHRDTSGIAGGISSGDPVCFRVAFKPTSSTPKAGVSGRHDACFALRTPVIVEAVAAIVFANLI